MCHVPSYKAIRHASWPTTSNRFQMTRQLSEVIAFMPMLYVNDNDV